jgi:hypothetical protein
MVPLGGCPGVNAGLGGADAPTRPEGRTGSVLQHGSPQAPSRRFSAGTNGRLRHPNPGDDPVVASPLHPRPTPNTVSKETTPCAR